MTLGLAVFAAAFVIGLAVGTYTRRPFVTACFLTGWRVRFRHLFVVPVLALVAAVVLVLLGAAL